MNSILLRDENDIQTIRDFLSRLPGGCTVVDFEEQVQLASVRHTTRLWLGKQGLLAFAWVDDYNNLVFDLDPQQASPKLEMEIIAWGAAIMRKRNAGAGEPSTLDASCQAANLERIALLERHGFHRDEIRSLHYARSLEEPIPEVPLPPGFELRAAHGEQEVEALVALHRAAFGTDNMTVEERLAIMRAPEYVPDLDLLVTASNGELCALCICGFVELGNPAVGYTDPIGVHAAYQGRGLGKAVVSDGLRLLRQRGAKRAELGTSSENLPMQRLAESLGFAVVSESVWFSKEVA
ncbi:MAG: GNAT family N-acetyltransferase [Anaerolineaceae bacterium]|nr:GNAT family N-acetyltransferase [Anaerolineaceae bacterium]